jgi:transposase
MAVAHTLLVIAYTMPKNSRSYQDLGGDYLEQINKDQLQRYFLKRLRRLGLKVTIEPTTAAA